MKTVTQLILQDADVLIYRIGHAGQERQYNAIVDGECINTFRLRSEAKRAIVGCSNAEILPIVVPKERHEVIHWMRLQLFKILEDLQTKDMRLFLTGDNNFRFKLATIQPYKGHRDKEDRPYWYDELRKYLVDEWDAEIVDGMEADDKLGIVQYEDYNQACCVADYRFGPDAHTNTIISTIDKDLNMIPGWHYNFVKEERYWVDEHEALLNFYSQLLTGDVSDNILGIPKVGPKTAEKLLVYCETEKEMYNVVRQCYQQNVDKFTPLTKLSIDEIIRENGKLLWIRRYPNEEWEPPV